MKRILFALACLAALTGGAGNVETGPVPTGQLKNPYEGDPQAIEYGAKLFKRISCHGCHGGNARGGTGPDLTDDEWLRTPTDEMIFNTIKNGLPGTIISPFRAQPAHEQTCDLVSRIAERAEKSKAE